jgi:hypothetical protein
MADRKISDLTALTAPAAGDYLPIVDISEVAAASKNKRITIEELFRGTPDGTAAAPAIAPESDPNTGIYSSGADQLSIATNGTERLCIDSSGRLLVGTSTARANFTGGTRTSSFQVEGTTLNDSALSILRNSNDTGQSGIYLAKSRSTAVGDATPDIVADGDSLGSIFFQGADNTNFVSSASITAQVDGTPGSNDMPGRLVFSTTADGAASPTERMRIDSTGQIEVASLGTAAAPVYSFLNDPNTGIYSPGADQLAISTGGTGRLFVDASGNVGINQSSITAVFGRTVSATLAGTGATYRVAGTSTAAYFFTSDGLGYGGLLQETNHPFVFGTNSTERMRLTSAGLLGLGTSSPVAFLHVSNAGASSCRLTDTQSYNFGTSGPTLDLTGNDSSGANTLFARLKGSPNNGNPDRGFLDILTRVDGVTTSTLQVGTGLAANVLIPNGRVGIGTAAPSFTLDIAAETPRIRQVAVTGTNSSFIQLSNTSGSAYLGLDSSAGGLGAAYGLTMWHAGNYPLVFGTNNTERARIDSSGRLLVGTSSSRATHGSSLSSAFQVEGTTYNTSSISVIRNQGGFGAGITLAGTGGTTLGSVTAVSSGNSLGGISFQGSDGANLIEAATIGVSVDGTPGVNDMPGRLVFSTTADGAASPTERMRITATGTVLIGDANPTSSSYLYVAANGGEVAFFNRNTSDGNVIAIRQDNVTEGTISVSGTTVSYNGAHLSRWSQLPGGAERTEILRGTVLSNIDEMCEWGKEDNEQLNRMKVSDVEGDKNVSGVFQAWDDDDDTYTDDFYCAMTGDFIIRIAGDVTVERGDLLMSAGDGTAKPQDDDIIRSKTIAKVTSTNVSCTYDDGSYCVPCVLMAC